MKSKIRIRFSLPFLLCLLPGILAGNGGEMLALTAAVLFHELCHCFTARQLGFVPEQIVLYPFGGSSSIPAAEGTAAEVIVSLAGPLGSLLAFYLCGMLPFSWCKAFASYCEILVAVNLLPLFPLDGGRVLRCFLQKIWPRKGKWISRVLSVALSALWLVFCVAEVITAGRSATLVMAGFLLYANLAERDPYPAFLKRPARIRRAERVQWIKASQNEKMRHVAQRCVGDVYYMILVTDENGVCLKNISERELYENLLISPDGTVGQVIRSSPIHQ